MRDAVVRLSAIALLLVASHDVLVSAKNVRRNVIKKSESLPSGSSSSSNRSGRSRGIKGAKPNKSHNKRGLQDLDATLEEGDTGIIGGSPAAANEFPFYVKFDGGTLCGGSLIAPDTVLTAAHCVDQGKPNQVRIGGTDYYGGELISTKCAVLHENFVENDKTLMNDVAIIKLQSPVSDTSKVIPFNKDTSYPSVGGTQLTVIGFGLTSPGNGDVSQVLQKLDTKFVTIDDCVDTYSERVVTPDSHICADVAQAGDCNGDSGGPVFDANGLQVGIVSFGYGGCASNQYQDVYVNIAAFSEWIERHVMGDDCEPFTGDISETSDSSTSTGTTTSAPATTTDTSTSGTTNAEEEAEEPSDLDAFLDCFTTIYRLVNSLLGDGDGGGGGGGLGDLLGGGLGDLLGGGDDGGKGGGDVEEEKGGGKGAEDAQEDRDDGEELDDGKGAGKGAIREFFLGVNGVFGGGR